jgi:hypothetical protein
MTTTWREIRFEIYARLPELIGHHRLQFDADWRTIQMNEVAHIARRLEEPHVAEIEAAVAGWTTGKPFQKLSPEAECWLRNRVETALQFVSAHTMTNSNLSKSVLAEPVCSLEEALKFLLTDWWEQHGRTEFFVSYINQKLRK